MANTAVSNVVTKLKGRWFGADRVVEVDRSDFYTAETMTTASLLGNGKDGARDRANIYAKYQRMQADPVISGCLRMHVTGALGGDDKTGDMVFIEATAAAKKKGGQEAKYAEELNQALGKLLNRTAMASAYNGVVYGDSYSRLYTEDRVGVVDINADEMLMPPLVQPYEVGNRTVVCTVAVGSRMKERLVMDQIARLKMPRMIYTPQPLAIEKAWRVKILENRVDKLPVMPSLAGGSFLAEGEEQFDRFVTVLNSLVAQRLLDSIDESIFLAQTQGMTKEQQTKFTTNIGKILTRSKQLADDALSSGKPFFSRVRHILPVWAEKQLVSVQAVNSSGGGSGRAGNVTIDDVIFHAKLLAGSMGMDLSQLGFADMLTGGLGEGGFNRTSVQSAERSRSIRTSFVDYVNHICDVHLAKKYGIKFPEGQRPWEVNFYGTIAAMESEQQKTRTDSANGAILLLQVLKEAKDAGLSEAATAHLLEREARISKEDAAMYAKDIVEAREKDGKENEGGGGFGGGGFGQGA